MHENLRTAGKLPSLDMPHHLRANEWGRWREGITIGPAGGGSSGGGMGSGRHVNGGGGQAGAGGTRVDVGLPQKVVVPDEIPPNTRVTVQFAEDEVGGGQGYEDFQAEAVTPETPREEGGYYWGYSIRRASSLSAVFTECVFDGGYDFTFGTSERGAPLMPLLNDPKEHSKPPIPRFRHMLLVFGGVAGLEVALKADSELVGKGVEDPGELFDYYVNLCPGQGSRTIRTEEAVWIGLMGLRGVVLDRGVQ